MKIQNAAVLVLAALVLSGLAPAHHSFFAVFDGEQLVTITGTVTEFRMVNPHAMMSIETVDDSGVMKIWTVEFDGRLHLSRAGWDRTTFTVGESLEITGNPARSGSAIMFFNHSVDASGKEIIRPRVALQNSIEERRRARRAQRNAQK